MDIEQKVDNISRTLIDVQQQLSMLNDNVGNLTVLRNALVNDIQLDNLTMEVVLEVSDSTLYRWRSTRSIPFHIRENSTIYYVFEEVLVALRKGDLNARGFNRLHAIEKMIEYRENIIHSKGSGSWFAKDKL